MPTPPPTEPSEPVAPHEPAPSEHEPDPPSRLLPAGGVAAIVGLLIAWWIDAPEIVLGLGIASALALVWSIGLGVRADQAQREARVELDRVGAELDEVREQLAQSSRAHSHFQHMIAAAPDAVFVTDPKGIVTTWNDAAEQIYGRSSAVAVGEPLLSVIEDEDDRFSTHIPRLLKGAAVEPFEATLTTTAGRHRDISVTIVPLPGEAGEVVALWGIARDITRMRQADRRLRLAVEASPSGVIAVDLAGNMVLVNAEAERLFGYPRSELLGRPIEMLLPARFRTEHPHLRKHYFEHPQARRMGGDGRALVGMRKDGTEFPLDVGLSPLETEEGPLVLSAIVDRTELQKSRDALEAKSRDLARSNADLEQFAYVASHDLQEPLRMIASYTELLGQRYQGQLDERADKYIHYAADGARRMQELLQGLLGLSRVGTEGGPLVAVVPSTVLDGVLANLRLAIRDANATIERAGALDHPVLADRAQLGQLLQNLVANSLKFRGERAPHVIVGAEVEGSVVCFRVKDNGIGFDVAFADRAFLVFQRLHPRTEYPGSGIGLAVAKKIVERHGGRIWLDSEPGGGTEASFTLPSAAESLVVEGARGDEAWRERSGS